MTTLPRRSLSEFLATALLIATVVGSGIMAERMAAGNGAIALLANTLATMGMLYVLIETFGPTSGAHMNPLVSAVMALRGDLAWSALVAYVLAQLLGATCGAWLAHAMFDLPVIQFSRHARDGTGQWLAEVVATAGLLLIILRVAKPRVAAIVAAYIGAAYWFTASTSFANPAAVLGRMLSDTFAGIAPHSVMGFIVAEVVGAAAGLGIHRLLGAAAASGNGQKASSAAPGFPHA